MRFANALLMGMLATAAGPAALGQTKLTAGQATKPAQAPAKALAPVQAAKPAPASNQAPAKPAPPTAQKPADKQAAKAAPAPAAKPAPKKESKPAQATAKAAKPAAKKSTQSAKKASSTPGAPSVEEVKLVRRDPFESLIGRNQKQASGPAIAGKPGLVISSLRLDGTVRAPNGMIAVVTNPQQRTYFLREGDQLYDGRVEKITMDGVTFHEVGKDAFGKSVERQVSKKIYSSPGELQ